MKLSNKQSSGSEVQVTKPTTEIVEPSVVEAEQIKTSATRPVSIQKKKWILLTFLILVIALAAVLSVSVIGKKSQTKQKAKEVKITTETEAASLALIRNNKDEALDHARKALSENPDDLDAVLAVAALAKEKNPQESKQYYEKALEIFAKQSNLDDNSKPKTAAVYWGAAGLAENAGNIDKAKLYYTQVVKTANQSDKYQKNLVEQSQAALKRLK